jgi:hypothetical protein
MRCLVVNEMSTATTVSFPSTILGACANILSTYIPINSELGRLLTDAVAECAGIQVAPLATEETHNSARPDGLSQLAEWLEPFPASHALEADSPFVSSDWIPLLLLSAYVAADVCCTWYGRGDLIWAVATHIRHFLN